VDTTQGLEIDDASRAAAARIPPFGHNSDTVSSLLLEQDDANVPLALPEDEELLEDHPMGPYWYFLFSHVQRVRMSCAERVGNRKSLRLGLPGFGCRYCASAGRLGLSRIFPARRRTLPSKISDLREHLRRCTLCPDHVKQKLLDFDSQREVHAREQEESKPAAALSAASSRDPFMPASAAGKEREFFTRIWARLGHGDLPDSSWK
jgi:hypothetical protein